MFIKMQRTSHKKCISGRKTGALLFRFSIILYMFLVRSAKFWYRCLFQLALAHEKRFWCEVRAGL